MSFSTKYAKFRGSEAFLYAVATFVGVWLLGHFTFGVDPTFGGLNLCLSIEASLSVALLIMHNQKSEVRRVEEERKARERHQKDMKHMLDIMEGIKLLLEENKHVEKQLDKIEDATDTDKIE